MVPFSFLRNVSIKSTLHTANGVSMVQGETQSLEYLRCVLFDTHMIQLFQVLFSSSVRKAESQAMLPHVPMLFLHPLLPYSFPALHVLFFKQQSLLRPSPT